MEFQHSDMPGVVHVQGNRFADRRGELFKLYHAPSFAEHGADYDSAELFFTRSHAGVVRGMHFQVPPSAHHKLVACLDGAVLDVLLDLRVGSPTYGETRSFTLRADEPSALFVPIGVAHGYCTLEPSLMLYNVSTEHDGTADGSIRWDSFGFAWPIDDPVMSDRDLAAPPFEQFQSPFVLETA